MWELLQEWITVYPLLNNQEVSFQCLWRDLSPLNNLSNCATIYPVYSCNNFKHAASAHGAWLIHKYRRQNTAQNRCPSLNNYSWWRWTLRTNQSITIFCLLRFTEMNSSASRPHEFELVQVSVFLTSYISHWYWENRCKHTCTNRNSSGLAAKDSFL